MLFTHRHQVRFGECDPAGILYYPRYFDLFHQTMEAWFGQVLGRPYHGFVRDQGYGVPAVHAEADYSGMSAFGDWLHIELRVVGLGRTSIRFSYVAKGQDGDLRASGSVVCVLMDLDPSRPTYRTAVALPDDLRQDLAAYQASC
ncbi:MAG: acyl-CoA thioesterase [Myxococcota bacterium]